MSPRASIFTLTKHGVFGAIGILLSPTATTGVYNNLESTVFLGDNDVYSTQTTGGQSVVTYATVIHAVVLALSVVGYSYSIRSSRLVISNTTYSASNKCDGNTSRYSDISDYWIVAGRAGVFSDVLLEQRWLGGSTRCSFLDISDIHISVWHHKRFRIAVWYLAADCMAISAITGKRHLWSARTGLLPVPRTMTMLGMRNSVVAGPVTWNSLPAAHMLCMRA